MCIAAPGKVKKIEGRKVFVEYPGEIRPALIGDDEVKAGDYVMVQMGIVVKVLSKKEAKEAQSVWQ